MRPQLATVAACAAALALGAAAASADGGSGTYTTAGQSYAFILVNSGTAPWQSFYLVGPPGTRFVGGAVAVESNPRCTVGGPDGRPDEIACGPLGAGLMPPLAHLTFVATLQSAVACGAPFELYLSTTAAPSFARGGDLTYAGGCAAPHALTRPLVHGTPLAGHILRGTPPTWSVPPTRLAYQWQRCAGSRCTAIAGATTLVLTLGPRDRGRAVRIVATATVGDEVVTSRSARISVRR